MNGGHPRAQGARLLLLGLVLLGIGFHWPLAFSNHTFWDGSLYVSMAKSDDLAGTYFPFRDSGQPAYGLYFYLLSFLPADGLAFFDHLISLVAIVSLAGMLFVFVRQVFETSHLVALLPAVAALSYPSSATAMSAVMTPTFVAQALLLALGLRYWRAATHGSIGPLSWAWICVAMILTTSSSGFVPQYYLVVATVSLAVFLKALVPRESLKKYVIVSLCFWGLPALFWTLNRALFPVQGKYTDYNAILPLEKVGYHLVSGLKQAVTRAASPVQPIDSASAIGALLLLGAFGVYAACVLRRREGGDAGAQGLAEDTPRKNVLLLTVWLFALGALGVLPYSAVGKVPNPAKWTMRWAIPSEPYFMAGLAVGVLALCTTLPRKLQGAACLALLVAFFAMKGSTLQSLNVELWLRKHQEQAIIAELKPRKDELLRRGAVCLAQDLDGARLKERLRPYEVASLMYQAYGGSMRGWFNSAWDDGYSKKEGPRRVALASGEDDSGDCVRIATRAPKSIADARASVVVSSP